MPLGLIQGSKATFALAQWAANCAGYGNVVGSSPVWAISSKYNLDGTGWGPSNLGRVQRNKV